MWLAHRSSATWLNTSISLQIYLSSKAHIVLSPTSCSTDAATQPQVTQLQVINSSNVADNSSTELVLDTSLPHSILPSQTPWPQSNSL